jgi:hypothetical protein
MTERVWFVEGMISHRTATISSGDGGSGKTQTAIQLIVAASLGSQWFGKDVGPGPCLLYTAEDEGDELWRRLATTVTKTGHQLRDLDGVRLIPMAGRDAVLAKPSGAGHRWKSLNIRSARSFPRRSLQQAERLAKCIQPSRFFCNAVIATICLLSRAEYRAARFTNSKSP